MACKCNKDCKKCNCHSLGLTTNIVCPCDIPACQNDVLCDVSYDDKCVYYAGESMSDTTTLTPPEFIIKQGTNLESVLQKFMLYLTNPTCAKNGTNVKSVEWIYITNKTTSGFVVNFTPVDALDLQPGSVIQYYNVLVYDVFNSTLYTSPNIAPTGPYSYNVSSPFVPIAVGNIYYVWVRITTKDLLNNTYTCDSIKLKIKI